MTQWVTNQATVELRSNWMALKKPEKLKNHHLGLALQSRYQLAISRDFGTISSFVQALIVVRARSPVLDSILPAENTSVWVGDGNG